MVVNKNIERIIIAGGGTGGHIFPAVAIANAIKKLQPLTSILFIGATGKMEMTKVPLAGYEIRGLDIAGYNRSSILKNISLPFKVVRSFLQVAQIFKTFKPQAVIGVGGYSSFPVLRYAQAKGIATYIHESNSYAGKANILLGKKATRIFTASRNMEQFFPAKKIMVTGNPVRHELVTNETTKAEGITFFGLEEGKMTVLIVGGSLGAQSINDAIAANLAVLAENNIQVIWQTGDAFVEEAKQLSGQYKNVFVSNFIQHMHFAYAAADIIISRSGAMAVAEICLAKKPVIFVPYPYAAEDHQTINAQELAKESAALVIADKKIKEELMIVLLALVKDSNRQEHMKKAISAFAITHADEIIAKEILFSDKE